MIFWAILSVILLIIEFIVDCGSWVRFKKWRLRWWDAEEWIISIFAAILLSAVLSLMVCGATIGAGDKLESYVYSSRTMKLSALENRNDQVYYAGFLGSGGGDNKQRIAYITKDKNGFQKLRKVDASKALIKEGSIKPKVVIEKRCDKVTNGLWDNLNFRFNRTRLIKWFDHVRYKFYVPKNTINKQYKVDVN